jgi:hypothetical protein
MYLKKILVFVKKDRILRTQLFQSLACREIATSNAWAPIAYSPKISANFLSMASSFSPPPP